MNKDRAPCQLAMGMARGAIVLVLVIFVGVGVLAGDPRVTSHNPVERELHLLVARDQRVGERPRGSFDGADILLCLGLGCVSRWLPRRQEAVRGAAPEFGLDPVAHSRIDTKGMNEKDECCGIVAAASSPSMCPTCSTKGHVVSLQTVKALVTESALRRLEVGGYRFCPGADCQTVYFADSHRTIFSRNDLRILVWQKEPPDTRMVCYCFGENEADIRAEIERQGSSAASQRVRGHVAARRCACDVRNPRGVCCLGDVNAAVARVESSVQRTR